MEAYLGTELMFKKAKLQNIDANLMVFKLDSLIQVMTYSEYSLGSK